MSVLEQIQQLRQELHNHNHNYYVLNQPTISDYDFDMMMHQLEELEAAHPEYSDVNSPTQRVGSDLNQQFRQVAHKYPMLSLSNTYNEDDVRDFYRRVNDGLNGEPFEIIAELKYDGLSISLTYVDGKLTQAVTRGDGVKGDDVTNNVRTIRSIPLVLQNKSDYPKEFEIRGEILMPWASFERLNNERELREEPLFANPRNAASGTLKSLNSTVVAERQLDAYLYYLIIPNEKTVVVDNTNKSSQRVKKEKSLDAQLDLFANNDASQLDLFSIDSEQLNKGTDGNNLSNTEFESHYEGLLKAKEWGFKISNDLKVCHSLQDVLDYLDYWATERKNLPVATDGVVLKVNSIRQQHHLGYTAKSPRWAIAYKFQTERACTRLNEVTYQVGRTGAITPVANMNPVQLAGTIVKRASLHNADIISQLDLHIGDMVYVEKGGEIIPKVVGVDNSQRSALLEPVKFITHCPECGTPLVRYEGEAAHYCPNDTGCPPQIKGRIEHFISRKAMNIESLGPETIDDFYQRGLVHDVADLYTLTVAQISNNNPNRAISAQKAVEAVKNSTNVPFERVLFAIGIRFVGETTAKLIARKLKSMDALSSATREQLLEIDGVGNMIADSILQFFANEKNVEIVSRLKSYGLNMELSEEQLEGVTTLLDGMNIVISGVFNHHSRDEYKTLIERNGGKNVSSISSKTSFVLAGENMGPSKLEKAQKLGVRIMTEDEFLQIIES